MSHTARHSKNEQPKDLIKCLRVPYAFQSAISSSSGQQLGVCAWCLCGGHLYRKISRKEPRSVISSNGRLLFVRTYLSCFVSKSHHVAAVRWHFSCGCWCQDRARRQIYIFFDCKSHQKMIALASRLRVCAPIDEQLELRISHNILCATDGDRDKKHRPTIVIMDFRIRIQM